VRVVNEAIQDGVGVGRIADEVVPFVDRQLTGDDGGAPAVAGFEEIVAGAGIERGPAEGPNGGKGQPALFTTRWRMWLNLLIQCMILVSNQNNAVSGKPHPP
jgi:hypothetical protein